jgi:hypothetical protein
MIAMIQNIALFSLSCFSLFQYSDSGQMIEDTSRVYKVIEINKSKKNIHSTNKAYIILVQDTLSKQYCTIVSLKTKCKNAEKIRKGEIYNFSLKKYYKYDSFIELGLKLSIYIDGVLINIPMSRYTSNLYTTTNLKGIYLVGFSTI